jgi:hypothetical protein
MQNQTIAQQSTEQVTAEKPRTLTYPLRAGGSITSTCPTWCSYDHSDDVAWGLTEPGQLYHHGDKVELGYHADGVDLTALVGRLVQWPFDSGEDAPYVEYLPEGSTGASLPLSDPLMVSEEIRKVRGHLRALEELGGQLAQAQADYHARRTERATKPWASLTRTDLLSMPIAYLLKVFGVTVVESEEIGPKVSMVLGGEPGDMLLMVQPDMPQHAREDETRTALLSALRPSQRRGGCLMPRRNGNVATPRHLAPVAAEGIIGLPLALPRKPVTRRAYRNASRRWAA